MSKILVNEISHTNDTTAMTIDSSGNASFAGRITSGTLPAFRAGNNGNYSHTSNNLVQFNQVSGGQFYNQGGHYSGSTYKFTAPVDGLYSFTAIVLWFNLSNGINMNDSLRFLLNDTTELGYGWRRAHYAAGYTGSQGYNSDFMCDQYLLSAGDTMGVRGKKTQDIHGNANYTYFTGHLVG